MDGLLNRGTFVLSIDLELGRGPAQCRTCNEVMAPLLKLMERFRIRATWAVMGNMLPDRTNSINGTYRLECGRLSGAQSSLNKPEAGSFSETKAVPALYCKDIIPQVMRCKVPQEIGCHTFSHIRVGDPSCSQEQFESELNACKSAAGNIGVNLRSFVFPYNSVGHLDSLRSYGFTSYRGNSPVWHDRLPILLRRPAHLLEHWLSIAPPVLPVSCEKGLFNIPASYFYACGSGWGRMIPVMLRIGKVKKGLHLAARRRRLFHLWFHPFNFTDNPRKWLKGLEAIFIEVCRYRKAGLLENRTMAEVARELRRTDINLAK